MQSFFHGDFPRNETFLQPFHILKKEQVTTVLFEVARRSIAEDEASVHGQITGNTAMLQHLASSLNLFLIKTTHRWPM